jgi:hypothetical protein
LLTSCLADTDTDLAKPDAKSVSQPDEPAHLQRDRDSDSERDLES